MITAMTCAWFFRHFPLLTIHDKAKITAEAAEAAGARSTCRLILGNARPFV